MGHSGLAVSTFASQVQGWDLFSLPGVCVEFACFPQASEVSSRDSGFLSQSKIVHSVWMEWECVWFLSRVYPALSNKSPEFQASPNPISGMENR